MTSHWHLLSAKVSFNIIYHLAFLTTNLQSREIWEKKNEKQRKKKQKKKKGKNEKAEPLELL